MLTTTDALVSTDSPPPVSALESLINDARAAGLQFRFYPGGSLVFEPAPRVRGYPRLEELRARRAEIARFLRATGAGSDTDTSWITTYQVMYPPLVAAKTFAAYADHAQNDESDIPF